jgi:hypothetical protein
VSEAIDIQAPGALWDAVEETDARWTKGFDRGQFKGTAVDALYNVRRLSHILGPVGFAWGWEIASERLDTFGVDEDQQVIHTCVLRVWFRQPDGSYRHCEHLGHTKASYWTRPRRPGDKPRFVVDDEFGKKSVTDALSKVMVNLGASADIWLGRFDGNKYVSYNEENEGEAKTNGHAADVEKLLAHARDILQHARTAATSAATIEAARKVKDTFGQQPFWSQIVATDRDLAAEIQSALRSKAAAYEVDLSTLTANPTAAPAVTDDRGEPTYKLGNGEHVPARKWLEAAEQTIRNRIASGLDPRVWWDGQKPERARLRKRKELHDALDDINALVEGAPAITARPSRRMTPDGAMRAG